MKETVSSGKNDGDSLRAWVDATIQSMQVLASTLGIEKIQMTEVSDELGDLAGNYIYLYGDRYAYRIGVLGSMSDFVILVKHMIGAEDEDEIADEEVYDGIGEIVNILVGNVKTAVGSAQQKLSIGLPMMSTGSIVYPLPEQSSTILAKLDTAVLRIVISTHPLPSEVRRQRLLEQAVRERENRLKSILDTAADAIFTVDDEGLIETINNAALKTFEVEAVDVIRQPVERILPGLLSVLEGGDGRAREAIGRKKNNDEFPVEISFSILSIGDRKNKIVIARDVTHRKELEAAMNQSKRLDAIGQLAAGIAHEINTPIQYIGDNAQFLKDSFNDIFSLLEKYEVLKRAAEGGNISPQLINDVAAVEAGADMDFLTDEIPNAITQALEGVERVASIVAAMKAFSHPSKTKGPADINKALQTTVTVCRNEWKYAADMTVNLDESLPLVTCVLGEVNQVFMNLIVNAAQAIAEKNNGLGTKGMITVETARHGDFVEVRVADNGNGIPLDVRDKIFEPFFTTKDVGKGTGQGLSISHSVIVKKHKGELFFKTEQGQGTTFFVRLPLLQEKA